MKQYLALVILAVVLVFTVYTTMIKPTIAVIEQRVNMINSTLEESK